MATLAVVALNHDFFESDMRQAPLSFSDALDGCRRPILLKNCSRLGQRGFAGGHKPSPERVAFNSGDSVRSNFAAVPAPLSQTSFSTVSTPSSRSVLYRADVQRIRSTRHS